MLYCVCLVLVSSLPQCLFCVSFSFYNTFQSFKWSVYSADEKRTVCPFSSISAVLVLKPQVIHNVKKSTKWFTYYKKAFPRKRILFQYTILQYLSSLPICLYFFSPLEGSRFCSQTHFQYGWSEIIFAAFCQNEIKCVKM